jgi:hypothetical protein
VGVGVGVGMCGDPASRSGNRLPAASSLRLREELGGMGDGAVWSGGECKECFRMLYNGCWQSPNLGERVMDVGG